MSEPRVIPEDDRVRSIRAMLNDPVEQTAPNNQAQGWRRDCDYLLTELDDKSHALAECTPLLRRLAKHCEDCQGSGEIVTGPNDEEATSEPCANCKPIWDLIERIEPKRSPSQRPELCGKEVMPGSYCQSDKGHEGECDELPF